MHARRQGGRYYWLWWTTIFHGLMTECTSYWYEDIDNFWHAQVGATETEGEREIARESERDVLVASMGPGVPPPVWPHHV